MVTGTLKAGIFAQKVVTYPTAHWDLGAVSRTTLILYNYATGKAQTGTFRNGLYKKVSSYSLAPGYNRIAASCDSVMLYSQNTRKAVSATLTNGLLGPRHKVTVTSTNALTGLSATCNSVAMLDPNASPALTHVRGGTLKSGVYTAHSLTWPDRQLSDSAITTTDTSVIEYEVYPDNYTALGTGTANNGTLTLLHEYGSIGDWGLMAGTADSVFLYLGDGHGLRGKVVNGVYTFVGQEATYSAGWTIIAGGK
jgi:hypothetical protein